MNKFEEIYNKIISEANLKIIKEESFSEQLANCNNFIPVIFCKIDYNINGKIENKILEEGYFVGEDGEDESNITGGYIVKSDKKTLIRWSPINNTKPEVIVGGSSVSVPSELGGTISEYNNDVIEIVYSCTYLSNKEEAIKKVKSTILNEIKAFINTKINDISTKLNKLQKQSEKIDSIEF